VAIERRLRRVTIVEAVVVLPARLRNALAKVHVKAMVCAPKLTCFPSVRGSRSYRGKSTDMAGERADEFGMEPL